MLTPRVIPSVVPLAPSVRPHAKTYDTNDKRQHDPSISLVALVLRLPVVHRHGSSRVSTASQHSGSHSDLSRVFPSLPVRALSLLRDITVVLLLLVFIALGDPSLCLTPQ